MITKKPDDCQHARCTGKRSGPHAADCPTRLGLADGDVLAFADAFITTTPVSGGDPRYVVFRGEFKGGRASSGPSRPRQPGAGPTDDERWIAEELISWARRNAVGSRA